MEYVITNDKNGFTLIEFLIALVILSVGMMGLLQAVGYSFHHNMETQLRDEGVRLADERMVLERTKPFNEITPGVYPDSVQLPVLNTFKNYSVVRTTTLKSSEIKTIEINVKWKYKGKEIEHGVISMVNKP